MTPPTIDPRFPNVFIIGAAKCGTTALHSALSMVPDVFMSTVKEPGFFSTDRHFRRGVEHYLDSFFSGAERFSLRGEATPWYLYSPAARRHIRGARGATGGKFIVLLRQPTDRAYSMYLDQRRGGLEPRTFEQAVRQELQQPAPPAGGDPPYRRYLWASRYAEHVAAWRAEFGVESVRVFLTDDLRQPERFWTDLSRFLDVGLGQERLSGLSRKQTNAAAGRRWPWVDRALRVVGDRHSTLAGTARKALPTGWYRRAAQTVTQWNQTDRSPPPEPPPAHLLGELDEHFRSEIGALETILDRSLAHWLPGLVSRAR